METIASEGDEFNSEIITEQVDCSVVLDGSVGQEIELHPNARAYQFRTGDIPLTLRDTIKDGGVLDRFVQERVAATKIARAAIRSRRIRRLH